MPLDPHFADRLHLLEGMTSIEAALADPQLAPRLIEFMSAGEAVPPPEVATRGDAAPGPHGPVPVRVYTPHDDGGSARPGLVWVHGGGFRMGSIDDPPVDALARELCARAGAVVVSVDYRLAVDGVCYPVPHDDVVAAVRWARDSAPALGIDADRITLGGDSAGGNLAAGQRFGCATTRAERRPRSSSPTRLCTRCSRHCPPGWRQRSPDFRICCASFPATSPTSGATTSAARPARPTAMPCPASRCSRGCARRSSSTPSVTILRASGELFVASLAQAGVDVRQVTAPGMLHAFLMLPDTIAPARQARELFAETVRRAGTRPAVAADAVHAVV